MPIQYVYDFGQEFSGVSRLTLPANTPRGASFTLKHAEVLAHTPLVTEMEADGSVYMGNLFWANPVDVYVAKGGGEAEVYEPSFTYHGFRCVGGGDGGGGDGDDDGGGDGDDGDGGDGGGGGDGSGDGDDGVDDYVGANGGDDGGVTNGDDGAQTCNDDCIHGSLRLNPYGQTCLTITPHPTRFDPLSYPFSHICHHNALFTLTLTLVITRISPHLTRACSSGTRVH